MRGAAADEPAVLVCRKTGLFAASPAPPLQFEEDTSRPLPPPPTTEDSLWRIERSLATGELEATETVRTMVRLLRKQVAREEEQLLDEGDFALS